MTFIFFAKYNYRFSKSCVGLKLLCFLDIIKRNSQVVLFYLQKKVRKEKKMRKGNAFVIAGNPGQNIAAGIFKFHK